MNRLESLRTAFAAVLATSGVVACGGSTEGTTTTVTTTPGGSTPTFTSLCNSGTPDKTLLQGLSATPAVDGVVYRSETAFPHLNSSGNGAPAEDGDGWTGVMTGEATGTLCKTATNKDACLAKVQGYRVLPTDRAACLAQYPLTTFSGGSPGSVTDCGLQYLIYTRGDDVGVARNDAETKALIGTFDTLEEAEWATQRAGYSKFCGATQSGYPEAEYRTTTDGGWDFKLVQTENCQKDVYAFQVHVDYAGNVTVVSKDLLPDVQGGCAVAGRRPTGLRVDDVGVSIGEHFASMATLEAASVISFRRLHRQLAAFGAPKALLDRVRKAARDEIRHARATGALARKYGVSPAAPVIAPETETSLFAIAAENAREGCVRETYGALVAHRQMALATDADVRTCMTAIADEETEHAALSWDIAAWIETQLSPAERDVLAAERHRAYVELAGALAVEVDADIVAKSGVPHRDEALRMLQGLAPIMLAA